MTVAQRLMESPVIARLYESVLWRRHPLVAVAFGVSVDAELRLVLDATAPSTEGRVLDVACGPGLYARAFAHRAPAGTVIGCDVSEPMLRMADRSARADGCRNLHVARGSALALPFADATFEVANCAAALHLFPDVPRALAEMHRVLAPGGRVAIAALQQAAGASAALLQSLRRRVLGLQPFGPGELRGLLERARFHNVDVLHDGRIWTVVVAHKEIT